jgi:hypothetical protein
MDDCFDGLPSLPACNSVSVHVRLLRYPTHITYPKELIVSETTESQSVHRRTKPNQPSMNIATFHLCCGPSLGLELSPTLSGSFPFLLCFAFEAPASKDTVQ